MRLAAATFRTHRNILELCDVSDRRRWMWTVAILGGALRDSTRISADCLEGLIVDSGENSELPEDAPLNEILRPH